MEFRYRARDKNGRPDRGVIEAPSPAEALNRLRGRELIISELTPATHDWPVIGKLSRSVSLRDRTLFTQELGLMLAAGIPLSRALEDLRDQTPNRRLRKVLETITADVRGGTSFSDALSKHPMVFPNLLVAVIRSGEASGKLVTVLERVTFQMEKDADLRGKVKSALIYPVILIIGILGVLVLVLVFVIPQLEGIFRDAGIALPLVTRILLAVTAFLIHDGVWLAVGLAGVVIANLLLLRLASVQYRFDRWKLKIPVFGQLTTKVAVARFATTASTLLTAGVPILEALDISRAVISNRYYERELIRVRQAAETGASLAATIRSGRIFPIMLANILAVGEESGNLAETFETVAGYYNKDIESTTRNLTTLLEPFLMIIMGSGIAFVMTAVLMPIYKLVQTI